MVGIYLRYLFLLSEIHLLLPIFLSFLSSFDIIKSIYTFNITFPFMAVITVHYNYMIHNYSIVVLTF